MTRLAEYLILGASLGALYALMAAGVTVVYQAARVPNVAFVAIGTVAAVLQWDLVTPGGRLGGGLGWWPALGLALAAAAGLGIVTDLIVRRLEERVVPALLLLLGWMAALLGGASALWGSEPKFIPGAWPGPPLTVGDLSVPRQHVATLLVAGACGAALTLFLRRTRFGLALRAAAADREAAGLMGMDPARLSRGAWALGSALASVGVILIVHPVLSSTFEQTVYVPFAFGAALLGGFRSLPLAAAGGMALGVVPSLLEPADTGIGGVRNVVAFLLIAGLLIKRPGLFGRLEAPGDADRAAADVPVPAPSLPAWARRAAVVGLGGTLAVAVPVLSGDAALEAWTHGISVFLVCASIVVVSGWTGEIPLGQVAFAGFGAYMAANLAARLGMPHVLAIPVAALSVVPFALLAGLPGFRVRSRLPFAVVTLALTVVASSLLWGPGARWFTGDEPSLQRPDWMEVIAGRPALSYYLIALAAAAAVVWFSANLRSSRVGRAFAAVRDSDLAARSLGIDTRRHRIIALSFAAFVAGAGGVVHAYLAGNLDPARFAAFLSVQYLLYTLIGGAGSLAGAAVVVWAFEVAPNLGGVTGGSRPGAVVVAGVLAVVAVRFLPGGLAGLPGRAHRARSPEPSLAVAGDDEVDLDGW